MRDRSAASLGVAAGISAYGLWGLFPLYFHALDSVDPVEIMAHRIVWSLVVTAAVVAWKGQGARPSMTPRTWAVVTLGALMLSANWLIYIWAVQNDHVVEAALGYFINPLVTVALGVVVLGERLRRLQWCAVALGFLAVVVLTLALGRPPVISLALAITFAGYGLTKKQVQLPAVHALAAETLTLVPVAIVGGIWVGTQGHIRFDESISTAVLLILSGPVTAIPLVLFGAAAARIPLSMMGLLQYLTPTLQFLLGLFVFHESVTASRWVGLSLVWGALAVLTVDAIRSTRGAGMVSPDPVGNLSGDHATS